MKNNSKFNLEKILKETTKKLKEASPEAQAYLLSLSVGELQIRLTSTQAQKIAATLLEKTGYTVEST
jgi:hypothetical protein